MICEYSLISVVIEELSPCSSGLEYATEWRVVERRPLLLCPIGQEEDFKKIVEGAGKGLYLLAKPDGTNWAGRRGRLEVTQETVMRVQFEGDYYLLKQAETLRFYPSAKDFASAQARLRALAKLTPEDREALGL